MWRLSLRAPGFAALFWFGPAAGWRHALAAAMRFLGVLSVLVALVVVTGLVGGALRRRSRQAADRR